MSMVADVRRTSCARFLWQLAVLWSDSYPVWTCQVSTLIVYVKSYIAASQSLSSWFLLFGSVTEPPLATTISASILFIVIVTSQKSPQ